MHTKTQVLSPSTPPAQLHPYCLVKMVHYTIYPHTSALNAHVHAHRNITEQLNRRQGNIRCPLDEELQCRCIEGSQVMPGGDMLYGS